MAHARAPWGRGRRRPCGPGALPAWGDESSLLAQRRWFLGWRAFVCIRVKGLPLLFGGEDGARGVRRLFAQDGEPLDAPGDHQVDGQTGLEPIGRAELPVLDRAAALEDAMNPFMPMLVWLHVGDR